MEQAVVILTGEPQAGEALAQEFQQRGARVFSGSTRTPSEIASTIRDADSNIDLLIVYPATRAPQPDYPELDFALLRQTYKENTLSVLHCVEMLLPLMKSGQKRLCFVTEGDPIQDDLAATNDLGDAMAKAALTMAYKNLFNDLKRDGYTFRLFRAEAGDEENFAVAATDYFLSAREGESSLVIRDASGKETVL